MIPFSTFGERFDFSIRVCVTYAVLFTLFLLNVITLPIPFPGAVKIPFILMAVYYWSIYRPTLIPSALVFIAGLLLDLLLHEPVGLNALILVLVHWLIVDQRSFLIGQSFLVVWFIFVLLNSALTLVEWVISGMINWQWVSFTTILPELLIGLVVFPIVCVVLHLSHKILPEPKMPLTRQSKTTEF